VARVRKSLLSDFTAQFGAQCLFTAATTRVSVTGNAANLHSQHRIYKKTPRLQEQSKR